MSATLYSWAMRRVGALLVCLGARCAVGKQMREACCGCTSVAVRSPYALRVDPQGKIPVALPAVTKTAMNPAPSQSQMRTVKRPGVPDTLSAQAHPPPRSQAHIGIHGPGTITDILTSRNVANEAGKTATRLSTAEDDAPPACSPRGIFSTLDVRTSRAI